MTPLNASCSRSAPTAPVCPRELPDGHREDSWAPDGPASGGSHLPNHRGLCSTLVSCAIQWHIPSEPQLVSPGSEACCKDDSSHRDCSSDFVSPAHDPSTPAFDGLLTRRACLLWSYHCAVLAPSSALTLFPARGVAAHPFTCRCFGGCLMDKGFLL